MAVADLLATPADAIDELGDALSGGTRRKDTAGQEGAFERALAARAATAETGCLTNRVESGDWRPGKIQRPALQVRLDAAKTLARNHAQLDRDERLEIEQRFRRAGA